MIAYKCSLQTTQSRGIHPKRQNEHEKSIIQTNKIVAPMSYGQRHELTIPHPHSHTHARTSEVIVHHSVSISS